MDTSYEKNKSLKEIETKLYSLYLEYKRLHNTNKDPKTLDNLITIISNLEYELIKHLKSRR